MPNIKSQKKRVKIAAVETARNQAQKSDLKTAFKKFDAAVVSGDKDAAKSAYIGVTERIDKAAGKRILHKKNAAHKKSSVAKKLNSMQ